MAGTGEAIWVQIDPRPDPAQVSLRVEELAREYRATLENIVEARGVPQVAEAIRGIDKPGALADLAGYSPDLSFERKVEVLETLDVEQRLEKVLAWAGDTLGEVALKDKIRSEVTEGMERNQREYILREQMDAIRKELGEDDEDVVEDFRKRIEDSGMPEAVKGQAERELTRLERTSPQNPEYGWILVPTPMGPGVSWTRLICGSQRGWFLTWSVATKRNTSAGGRSIDSETSSLTTPPPPGGSFQASLSVRTSSAEAGHLCVGLLPLLQLPLGDTVRTEEHERPGA